MELFVPDSSEAGLMDRLGTGASTLPADEENETPISVCENSEKVKGTKSPSVLQTEPLLMFIHFTGSNGCFYQPDTRTGTEDRRLG